MKKEIPLNHMTSRPYTSSAYWYRTKTQQHTSELNNQ